MNESNKILEKKHVRAVPVQFYLLHTPQFVSILQLKSDGMFDLEASYKLAEEAKEGDEKRLENGKKLADLCVKGKSVIYDNIH